MKSLKAEMDGLENKLKTVTLNKQEGQFPERAIDDLKDEINNLRNANNDNACRLRLWEEELENESEDETEDDEE